MQEFACVVHWCRLHRDTQTIKQSGGSEGGSAERHESKPRNSQKPQCLLLFGSAMPRSQHSHQALQRCLQRVRRRTPAAGCLVEPSLRESIMHSNTRTKIRTKPNAIHLQSSRKLLTASKSSLAVSNRELDIACR
jgi:hypothetical protein